MFWCCYQICMQMFGYLKKKVSKGDESNIPMCEPVRGGYLVQIGSCGF